MAKDAKQDLLPVYLIVGDDLLKRDAVLKKLRMRLEKLGDLSFNFDQFNGEGASGEEIVNACQTIPFACEKRLVLVNDAEALKKADSDQIVDYLKDPNASSVLVLVCEKLAKSTRLYKAIDGFGSNAIIDCSRPKRRGLVELVVKMGKPYGLNITAQGAEKLIEMVGDDTLHLDGEINKISLSVDYAKPIDESVVEEFVAQVVEAKPWDFVDAFSARNIAECIRLKALMPSVSVYALFGMCVTRIRELICAKSLGGNQSQNALANELGVPDWKVRNYFRYSDNFTSKELRDMLSSAIVYEKKMKSGTDPDAAFIDWVLASLSKS